MSKDTAAGKFLTISRQIVATFPRNKNLEKTLKSRTRKKETEKDTTSGGLDKKRKSGRRWFSSNSPFLHGARHSSSLSWLFSGPNSL